MVDWKSKAVECAFFLALSCSHCVTACACRSGIRLLIFSGRFSIRHAFCNWLHQAAYKTAVVELASSRPFQAIKLCTDGQETLQKEASSFSFWMICTRRVHSSFARTERTSCWYVQLSWRFVFFVGEISFNNCTNRRYLSSGFHSKLITFPLAGQFCAEGHWLAVPIQPLAGLKSLGMSSRGKIPSHS